MHEYRCQYGGLDDVMGKKRVRLVGLESFGHMILNFLKRRIDHTYPKPDSNVVSSLEDTGNAENIQI